MHIAHHDEAIEFAQDLRSKDAKVLLICSGGYDSTSLAYLLKEEGYNNVKLLHIDFNQKAKEFEKKAVTALAEKLGYELDIVKVDWDMSSIDAFKATTHVGRNGMFVWKAMTKAHVEGYDAVMTGIYELDQPDCQDEFMAHLERAFELGYEKKIKISRPLVFIDKVTLGEALKSKNIYEEVLESSYSCYLEDACGECASCIERAEVIERLA